MNKIMMKKGFTLIELLIVIAIMAIIASVIFVALNPLKRLQDSRDSVRWQQASQILSAIKLYQIDNDGYNLQAISNMVAGNIYMIGTNTTGCDDQNAYCDSDVFSDTACVNLSGLVDSGYLSKVPISPNGSGVWYPATVGYTLSVSSTGVIFVRACESENSSEIELSR